MFSRFLPQILSKQFHIWSSDMRSFLNMHGNTGGGAVGGQTPRKASPRDILGLVMNVFLLEKKII